MSFIFDTAVGKREYISVFGSDYDIHDCRGVRDYIYVVDLSIGHVKAIECLNKSDNIKPLAIKFGIDIGYSVRLS